jgi:hypothetical protein
MSFPTEVDDVDFALDEVGASPAFIREVTRNTRLDLRVWEPSRLAKDVPTVVCIGSPQVHRVLCRYCQFPLRET